MNCRQCRIAWVIWPLLIVGCGGHDSRVVELFGGKESFNAVLSPGRVEAYRISSEAGVAEDVVADQQKIDGFPVTAGPVEVDQSTVDELTDILADAGTYDWPSAKGCEFRPGVVVRFIGSAATIDVLFCFSCDELKILRDGKKVGGEDFDAARSRLVSIVKQLFPDDEEIQSL